MTVSYSTNLGLALPAQGDWAGSWGTNQNQFITQYLDAAIAGAQVISGSQTAVTLSTTNGLALSQAGSGATGSAQYAVINCTGNPASMLTITAPLTDKTYVIINATSTSQDVKIVGVGPTTGVTVAAAIAAMVAWNGADFVLVATTDASKLAGTLAVANGGTGQTTYTNGQLLIGNSTGNTLTKANLTAGTGIAITNGAGSITVGGTAATLSDIGMVKLGDATVQTVAANAVSATASRTYALQVNASGQGVVNVPWTDTVYTLPSATDSVLGGIKLGDATVQTVAANAVTATASRTYALQLNASGQAVVNVPWIDTTNSPAGSNTQIQFNNSGAFGASANLTFASDTLAVNGVSVGRGAGAVATNTAIGASALLQNATAANVVAVGNSAMERMKSINPNTALGSQALQGSAVPVNNSGSWNVAVGDQALSAITSGNSNVAVGSSALPALLSSTFTTAVGYQAGLKLTTGGYNTVVGAEALAENLTGNHFTALGYRAMGRMQGAYNTAVGPDAMRGSTFTANNTGTYNIALGSDTLASLSTGNNNIAIGHEALNAITTNSNNTAVGYRAGKSITTGQKNTIVGGFTGLQGGLDIRAASNNIVLSDGDGNPRWYVDANGSTGYAPSTGGSVTQTTSRTTAVTLNTPTGLITLVSAAGTTAWQSFTVNNSSVSFYDTIHVVQRTGTDLYQIFVTAVTAGSFRITFATTGGTTTEQPSFTFAVIKGQIF